MSSPNKPVLFVPYLDQNYEELRRECLAKDILFVDPKFSREKSFFTEENLIWRRPYDITPRPQFFINTAHRRDPGQGELSDCWFVVAVANITSHQQIFERVVPGNQTFEKSQDYIGIFHFHFWQFGVWYDVVIDDYLPFNQQTNQPYCSWNRQEPEEFWVALIEKAYAKINGGYQNMNGGAPIEAFTDFTAGVEQRFKLNETIEERKPFFHFLMDSLKHACLMACSINPQNDGSDFEEIKPNGLVVGHSYSITAARYLQVKKELLPMIRLRNPWANEIEWAGAWHDRDKRWNYLDLNEKRRMSWQNAEDGEFWMNFDDFFAEFDILEICHLSPDTFEEELQVNIKPDPISSPARTSVIKDQRTSIVTSLSINDIPIQNKTWSCLSFQGQWIPNLSSGGRCVTTCDHGCDFWTNPQYEVETIAEDPAVKCAIVISLMQKYNRLKSTDNPLDRYDYIQARIYKIIMENPTPSPRSHARQLDRSTYGNDDLEYVGYTGSYINRREVSSYLRVSPGRYLVIPTLYEPNREGHFLLRIFIEANYSHTRIVSSSPSPINLHQQLTRLTIANPVSSAPTEKPRCHCFCPFDCFSSRRNNQSEIHLFHSN